MDSIKLDTVTFLATLDEKELIAYNIAASHLGKLFSLDKSNCYLEWVAEQKAKYQNQNEENK